MRIIVLSLRLASGFRQILLSSKPFIIKSKPLNGRVKSVLFIFLLVLLVLQDAELLAERLDVVDDLVRGEHSCELAAKIQAHSALDSPVLGRG